MEFYTREQIAAEMNGNKLNEIERNITIALYEDYRICESEYDRQSVEGTASSMREQIQKCRNIINRELSSQRV